MIFFLDCTCVDKTKRAVAPHFRFVTRLDIGRRRLNSSLKLYSWTELSDVFRLIQEGPLGLLLLKPRQLTSVSESQKINNVKLCLNKLLQTTRVKCLLKRLGLKAKSLLAGVSAFLLLWVDMIGIQTWAACPAWMYFLSTVLIYCLLAANLSIPMRSGPSYVINLNLTHPRKVKLYLMCLSQVKKKVFTRLYSEIIVYNIFLTLL